MRTMTQVSLFTLIATAMCVFTSCGESSDQGKEAAKDFVVVEPEKKNESSVGDTKKVKYLTSEDFKKKVYDYKQNQEWKFEGDLPCIVDFYADWCRPCKIIEPIMEELAAEYEGRINIYKVNTDKEREVSAVMGIRSIPALLFCPMGNAQPRMAEGALPKETYVEYINTLLLNK